MKVEEEKHTGGTETMNYGMLLLLIASKVLEKELKLTDDVVPLVLMINDLRS